MAAPFLVKRRSGWYLRLRIPVGLRPLFGSHLTRTLQTRDYAVARRRAVMAAARLQACWQEVWRTMATATGLPLDLLTAEDLIRADRDRVGAVLARLAASMRTDQMVRVNAAARQAWDGDGQHLVPPAGAGITEQRLAGRLEGMREAMALLAHGGVSVAPAPAAVAPAPPAAPPTAIAIRAEGRAPWPTLIEPFFAARPSVGDSAEVSHRQAFGELQDLIGAKPLDHVTKGDIACYVESLEGRTNGRGNRAHLHHDTIVKKLQHVRSFFSWAVEKAYIAADPAAGVKPRTKTAAERNHAEDRRAFTIPELERLFHSPLYTGCAGLRHRATTGGLVLRDERFWIFPVALMTGARVEELAEAPALLVDLGGIPCLNLTTSGTKTPAAPRLVPILPELTEIGFLSFAAGKAAKGEGLFQGDSASGDWSKWTNRYLDDIGLIDPTTTTHSMRHCNRQMLRAGGIGDELADKVFGHQGGRDDTGAGYGRALAPDEARLFFERVRSPISLRHLRLD